MAFRSYNFTMVIFILNLLKCGGQKSTNLLKNPDFEDPFGQSNWFCAGGCKLERETDAYSGRFSGKVTSRTQGWHGVSQRLNLNNGGRYKFELRVKMLNESQTNMFETVRAQVAFSKEDGSSEYARLGSDPRMRADLGWQIIGGDFKVPDTGVTSVRIYLTLTDLDIDHLVDAATLTEIPHDPDWREKANQRIDEIRKNNVILNINLGENIDVRNTKIEVMQKKKSFPFGCVGDDRVLTGSSLQSVLYREFFFDMFTWGVLGNVMKWHIMERDWFDVDYERADTALSVLTDRGIKMRGHCMYWGVEKNVPYWLFFLSGPEVKVDVYRRAMYAATHYKGRVEHWDVNNEHLHGAFFEESTGEPHYYRQILSQVHEFDKEAELFVNDYNVISSNDVTYAMLRSVQDLIKNDAPLHGIGVQSHFQSLPDITLVNSRIDTIAEAGLPIWVTELDVVISNKQERAQGYEDILTLYYSRPEIEGIIIWGFWDEVHWRPDGALLEGDLLEPNVAGTRFIDLLKNQWMTSADFFPQAPLERFEFRGFHGDYELTVRENGAAVHSEEFTLKKGEDLVLNIEL